MDSPISGDNQYQHTTRWTPKEGARLTGLVQVHGSRDRTQISESMKGQNSKSGRLRWCNQLTPKIDHGPFTPKEDEIIIRAHARLGNKWAEIARSLNGHRTNIAVKNRWNSTLRHRLRNRVSTINLNSMGHGGSSESDSYRPANEVEPSLNPDQVNFNHVDDVCHGGSSKTNDDDVYRPVVKVEPYPYPDQVNFNYFYRNGLPFYLIQEGSDHFSKPMTGFSFPESDSMRSNHLGEQSSSHGRSVPFGGFNIQNQPPQVEPLTLNDEGENGFDELVVDVTRDEVIKYKNKTNASGDACQFLPGSDSRKSLSTHKFDHLGEPSLIHGGSVPFGGFNMQNQPPKVVPLASNDKVKNGFQKMAEDVTREEVIKYKNQASASAEVCHCTIEQIVHAVLHRIGFQRDAC